MLPHDIIEDAAYEFGLLFRDTDRFECRRKEACRYVLTWRHRFRPNPDLDSDRDRDTLLKLADRLNDRGYLSALQKDQFKRTIARIVERTSEHVPTGYHATRTCNIEEIREQGLLPGHLSRRNTDRYDTLKCIYFATVLGSLIDLGTRVREPPTGGVNTSGR